LAGREDAPVPEPALAGEPVRVAPNREGRGVLALEVREDEETVRDAAAAGGEVTGVEDGDGPIEEEGGESAAGRPMEGGAAVADLVGGVGAEAGFSGLSQLEKKSSSSPARVVAACEATSAPST
jgi:hypothetical protein